MEYFIYGIVLGYFLFPLSEIVGKIVANAWDASSGCGGNCNQGRRACDCGRQ